MSLLLFSACTAGAGAKGCGAAEPCERADSGCSGRTPARPAGADDLSGEGRAEREPGTCGGWGCRGCCGVCSSDMGLLSSTTRSCEARAEPA